MNHMPPFGKRRPSESLDVWLKAMSNPSNGSGAEPPNIWQDGRAPKRGSFVDTGTSNDGKRQRVDLDGQSSPSAQAGQRSQAAGAFPFAVGTAAISASLPNTAGPDDHPAASQQQPNFAGSNDGNELLRMLLAQSGQGTGLPYPGIPSAGGLITQDQALRVELSAQEMLQRQALQEAANTNANAILSMQQPCPLGSLVGSLRTTGGAPRSGGPRVQREGLAHYRSPQDTGISTQTASNFVGSMPASSLVPQVMPPQVQGSMSASFPVVQGGGADVAARSPSATAHQQLTSLLQQLHASHPVPAAAVPQGLLQPVQNAVAVPTPASPALAAAGHVVLQPMRNAVAAPASTQASFPLLDGMPAEPPCAENRVVHFSMRPMYSLAVNEDPNWLSEFHCFVRAELIEVFRASREDCKARNNGIMHHQVGIRCRYCAHASAASRAGRSSAFPSSLRRIYQSFTMMLRDHFANCDAMPQLIQERFLSLKDKPSQGATDSKSYWIYSAMKIGMTDSQNGIVVTDSSRAQGARAPPFGTSAEQQLADDAVKDAQLVHPSDRTLVSEFLFLLMSQTKVVRLAETERVGNRRSLRVGLPGFGCRFCAENRRLGLCRMFPARRRTLPGKVSDLYEHLRRCTVCPTNVKESLDSLHHQMNTGFHSDQGGDREFFDRVWKRLGHSNT